jgi:uncharacterized protein YacL
VDHNWKRMIGSMTGFTALNLLGMAFVPPIYHNVVLAVIILCGGIFAGWLWQRFVFGRLMDFLKRVPGPEIFLKGIGILFSLLVVALISLIFRPLFELLAFKEKIGLVVFMFFPTVWLSLFIASVKAKEVGNLVPGLTKPVNAKLMMGRETQLKVLDTSSIIDGRIADLCKTGFLEGVLVIPGFVLGELQKIADSADPLRRNRGRRGLDLLNRMQKENGITLKIFDRDYDDINEVDTKLLKLAREMEAKVITNDFNLNKVAELYGVQVLNINELSNAIKPLVLPGEEMAVHILRDGKEFGQGIGYLDDGTMIVVEGGKNYIGLDIDIMVTSVLQTSAGRMIFAKPKEYYYSKVTS